MLVLGIETSCDETSAALVADGRTVLSNVIATQLDLLRKFGGVVPEIAARRHTELIGYVINEAIDSAGKTLADVEAVSVTAKQGLIGCLLVGVAAAKALSYSLQVPLIGVHHIEGHIYANWLNNSKIEFPTLALVVSGGHTQLVLIKKHGDYMVLGETRDDAAGEAFDKVAKLLGLGYPGGPIISQRAEKGNSEKFNLPRPMINRQNFDFSFSGLKTAVLYEAKKQKKISNQYINDMAASFQQATIDVLVYKTIKAAKEYKVKNVILSGGVAANKELRNQMQETVEKKLDNVNFQMPEIKLCTDNAAMICATAFFRKKLIPDQGWFSINANSNLKLFT